MKKRLNKKGFTLIELIVVIAIIAVLAIVGIPAIAGQVTKAKDAAAAANIRMIASAFSVGMAAVDIEVEVDRMYVHKGTTDEIGKKVYDKVISVIGSKFEEQFRIVANMDDNDPDQGLFYLYFTDKPPLVDGGDGYTYFGGKITKGKIGWTSS